MGNCCKPTEGAEELESKATGGPEALLQEYLEGYRRRAAELQNSKAALPATSKQPQSDGRTVELVQAELSAAMRERDVARIRALMNERNVLQKRRQEENSQSDDNQQNLSDVEAQVKEWLSGNETAWDDDARVVAWVMWKLESEGMVCPRWLDLGLKTRIRKHTLEDRKRGAKAQLWESMPRNALLCEEAWAFAHQLWTQMEMGMIPKEGFWPDLDKALRQEAHAKLVQLTVDLRSSDDSSLDQVEACENLKNGYDQEILQYHHVVPASYVCAICGGDNSDHVHDARALETYTLACGHQACSKQLGGWLQSQLNAGVRAVGLRCPFRDPRTGERCNKPLSDVQGVGGVSNLPQMLQELLPQEVSQRVFQQMAEAAPNLIFCPRSSCSAAWWLEDRELTDARTFTCLTCESCRLEFCCKCPHGPHVGKTCNQIMEEIVAKRMAEEEKRRAERAKWRTVDGHDEDQELLGKFSKSCPKCGSMTLKDGGCRHMTCPCGAHWCYECHKVFPQKSIANHMFSVHNGWYDDENKDSLQLR